MKKTNLIFTAQMGLLLGTVALVVGCGGSSHKSSQAVSLKQNVLDAYATFAASDTGKLIQKQGKMATPNVYLANIASGSEATGAKPAKFWYVRNGVHDDGVSLVPLAVLNANLTNLKAKNAITDFNFDLIMNMGHTENVSTKEAFGWMDYILANEGSSTHTSTGTTGWWDVTSYTGGTFVVDTSGNVTSSSDNGKETLAVTLDGASFNVTHYWGWYANAHNSAQQKINIYVPQNATANSATYFKVNNAGWMMNSFPASVIGGQAYTTGNLTYNTNTGNDSTAEVLKRGMIIVSYGARGRADAAVSGEYLGHSPAVMTDTKAAIRFLKYNMVYGSLPGDPERIIITGMSGGGGLTTTVAAGGNSSDYFESLVGIGALGVTSSSGSYTNDAKVGDNVFATFSSAPIIDLFKADYAMEWMYNPTRQKVANGDFASATGFAASNTRYLKNYIADWQNLASTTLAQQGYQDYIVSLGLTVNGVKRTLLDMVEVALERTLNENKSYMPAVYDVSTVTNATSAKTALDTFLRYSVSNSTPTFAALPLSWYTVTGTPGNFSIKIEDSAWDAFCEYSYWTSQWVKSTPGSDNKGLADLGYSNFFTESDLWGTKNMAYGHTNPVSWALDTANWSLLGLTPSTLTVDADRQAANRALAVTLFNK